MKTRYLTRRVKHVKSENKKVYDLDILMVMNGSFKHDTDLLIDCISLYRTSDSTRRIFNN